jgi:hypothetical protein
MQTLVRAMPFLDWWAGLSRWIRYPVALLLFIGSLIGLGTIRMGYGHVWGLGMAFGFILLLYGPSKADV